MWTNRWIVGAMLIGGLTVNAQEKNAADKSKSAETADPTKAEVWFSKEHVPDDLKVGTKVDLRRVDSQTVTGTGRSSIRSSVIVPGLEVVAVTKIDKPKTPDEAVKVVLKGTKDQIEKVNKYKDHTVRVVERKPGGGVESRERKVPLRLETVPSDQKKSDDGKKEDSKKSDTKKAGDAKSEKGSCA